MSARKPTKAERAAKRRQKESAAKRDKRKPLAPLDVWAIYVLEAREALMRQGMSKDDAMDYLTSTFHIPRIPDWSHQNPDQTPYEDDDEDE